MDALPFAKIPLDISFTKLAKKGEHVITYGAISYYKVLGLPFPYKHLKMLQPDTIRYVEIVSEDQVSPHRDHTTKTAFNCYFESGDATTHFWEERPGAEPIRFPGATTSNIFKNMDDLKYIASFTAADGDAYLLDVSCIHSVERTVMKPRRFIQLIWRSSPFTEVLSKLKSLS
jgi:hypothetical protein